MLRAIVLALGALCCLGGGLGLLLGAGPGMLPVLILGSLVLAGTVFERHYHRNLTTSPGAGWERTEESFKDPSTGQMLDVWYNPNNGQRRYVIRQ
jgi:hypothetical protein